MSNRLELIAAQITDGIGVVDVGTDHGYLPIVLAERGYRGNIIATDINEAPLDKARRNLEDAGFGQRTELFLCDGLELVDPEKVDTIVIAGMGGDTVTGILDRAEWCQREDIKLILQPVTKPEILRYWLVNNDFIINRELQTEENATLYQIICASPGKSPRYSDSELFVGKFEQIKDSPYFEKLTGSHIKRFENAVKGLNNANRGGLKPWLELMKNMIDELKSARGEYSAESE